jgi:hypothetical protein
MLMVQSGPASAGDSDVDSEAEMLAVLLRTMTRTAAQDTYYFYPSGLGSGSLVPERQRVVMLIDYKLARCLSTKQQSTSTWH